MRRLGAAEPAAVDTDQDGYLDRIYIGTNRGFVYRVDLRGTAAGELPELEQVIAGPRPGPAGGPRAVTVQRILPTDSASRRG